MNNPNFAELAKQKVANFWDRSYFWIILGMVLIGFFVCYSLGTNQAWYEHDQIEKHCVDGQTDWRPGQDIWGRTKVEWFCFQRSAQ